MNFYPDNYDVIMQLSFLEIYYFATALTEDTEILSSCQNHDLALDFAAARP